MVRLGRGKKSRESDSFPTCHNQKRERREKGARYRWIERLLARLQRGSSEALSDLRRHNGASAAILKPELLAKPAVVLGHGLYSLCPIT